MKYFIWLLSYVKWHENREQKLHRCNRRENKGKINTYKQKRPRMWRQKKETGYIIVVFQLILQQFNTRKYNRKTISATTVTKLGYKPKRAVAHSKGGGTCVKCLSRSFQTWGWWQELECIKCHNSTMLKSGGVWSLPGSAVLVVGPFGRALTSHPQRKHRYLLFSMEDSMELRNIN